MLNDTERASFEVLRKRVEDVEGQAKQHRDALVQLGEERDQVIKDYRSTRLEALKREMMDRGVICCTNDDSYPHCEAVVRAVEATFLFVESSLINRFGSHQDRYDDMVNTRKLHQVCPTCAKKMRDKHGWVGPFEKEFNKNQSFHAFAVEERSDGLYMNRFGTMIKLTNEEVGTLSPLSERFINRYTKEWGLPPDLETGQGGGIVMHEIDPVPVG